MKCLAILAVLCTSASALATPMNIGDAQPNLEKRADAGHGRAPPPAPPAAGGQGALGAHGGRAWNPLPGRVGGANNGPNRAGRQLVREGRQQFVVPPDVLQAAQARHRNAAGN